MVYYGRALLSGRQKLAYVFAALLLILLMVVNPRIAEIILIFSLTGSIPGTDIVVSPDVVLAGVAGILTFMAVFGIMRMKIRAHRLRRNTIRIPVKVVAERTIPVVEAVDSPVVEGTDAFPALRRKHRSRMVRKTIIRNFRDAMRAIVLAIIWVGIIISNVIKATVLFIAGKSAAGVRGAYRFTGAVVRFSLRFVRRSAIVSIAFTRTSWKRTKSHLSRLDTWIELQLRKIETSSRRKLKQYETVRTVSAMSREYRKSVGAPHLRLALDTSKQKALSLKDRIAARPTNR